MMYNLYLIILFLGYGFPISIRYSNESILTPRPNYPSYMPRPIIPLGYTGYTHFE